MAVVRTAIGIDPGPTVTGWVEVDLVGYRVTVAETVSTGVALVRCRTLPRLLDAGALHHVAIEDMEPRGMPAGHDIIETTRVVGMMQEATRGAARMVRRRDVKLALCGSSRVRDTNVNAAVRAVFAARHGMSERELRGRKASPGPLYGVAGHAWSALAVLVVSLSMHEGSDYDDKAEDGDHDAGDRDRPAAAGASRAQQAVSDGRG